MKRPVKRYVPPWYFVPLFWNEFLARHLGRPLYIRWLGRVQKDVQPGDELVVPDVGGKWGIYEKRTGPWDN